jgi:5'-3' exonuclease
MEPFSLLFQIWKGMKMSKRLIIIDGNSLLFRAYYATAYLGTDKIMKRAQAYPLMLFLRLPI